MKLPIFFLLCFLSFTGSAQDAFTCDSIFIDCCQFGLNQDTEISLQAANHSPDIISYPNFVLLDETGDTIAKEEYTYYGIGFNDQLHTLQVMNLPGSQFDGTLELHGWFQDTLYCSFPFSFGDQVNNVVENMESVVLNYYPNPATNMVQVDFKMHFTGTVKLYHSNGQLIKAEAINNQLEKQVNLPDKLAKGIYIVQLLAEDGAQLKSLKLRVE